VHRENAVFSPKNDDDESELPDGYRAGDGKEAETQPLAAPQVSGALGTPLPFLTVRAAFSGGQRYDGTSV